MLVHSRTDTCSFYRSGGVIGDLRKHLDIDIVIRQWNEIELHWQKIVEFDLIFLQRPYTDVAVNFVQFLKGMNIPSWVDYDDYLLGVPVENKYAGVYTPQVRENVKKLLGLADAVSVTTQELANLYHEFVKVQIRVIPNAFNDFIFRKRMLIPERQKLILWRGSDSHIYDIMTQGNAINEATEMFPDWKFTFLGFYPWFLSERDNMFHLKEMDVILYHSNLLRMAPALVHVPLNDSPFNRAKSNIAYIEAAYAGAVALVPDWEEWKRPGAILYNDNATYLNGIKAVTNGEYDTRKGAKAAWEYISDQLMLSKVNRRRVEIIQSLL